jgi:hypothetical protein
MANSSFDLRKTPANREIVAYCNSWNDRSMSAELPNNDCIAFRGLVSVGGGPGRLGIGPRIMPRPSCILPLLRPRTWKMS